MTLELLERKGSRDEKILKSQDVEKGILSPQSGKRPDPIFDQIFRKMREKITATSNFFTVKDRGKSNFGLLRRFPIERSRSRLCARRLVRFWVPIFDNLSKNERKVVERFRKRFGIRMGFTSFRSELL